MKIVFVCTGNTCRSPMAEAILKDYLKRNSISGISVSSCGLQIDENYCVTEEKAIVALKNIGINARRKKSKVLTKHMLNTADYVVTMTKKQKDYIDCKNVYTLSELSDCGDIIDPYGRDQSIYNVTALKLKDAICLMAENILRNKL